MSRFSERARETAAARGATLASVKPFFAAIVIFNIAFDFAIHWLSETVYPLWGLLNTNIWIG